jgi:carbon monoxide dehydrogenase subunit G
MKLEATFQIAAGRNLVWDLLNDPQVLARALPGCERLTPAGPDRFEGSIKVGIASVVSTYDGTVQLRDIRPGEGYTMDLDGQGKGGFVRGHGTIGLRDEAGQTLLAVAGDAQVGGRIASVGQRLLDAAARKLLKEFAAALGKEARARLAQDFQGFRP